MPDFPICLCGANKYRVHNYKTPGNDFSVIICGACSLARTWPQPIDLPSIDDFYKSQTSHQAKFDELPLRQSFSHRPLEIIKKYFSAGSLLDVGCSAGVFVAEAKKYGFDARGIDLSESAIELGRHNFGLGEALTVGSLKSLALPAGSFEVITYLHCLEHIVDPIGELSEAKRVLSDQGILVLELPRFFSLWRFLLGARWYGMSPTQHIWQFGWRGAVFILERSGFEVIYAKKGLSMYHKITADFSGLVKLLIYAFAWLSKTGDNLFIVARKKK